MAPSRRTALVSLGLYAVLAVASFVPQSLRPWDTVAYIGDSTESAYIVEANVRQFFANPLHVLDGPAFFPYDRTIAFTDHRLLPSLLVAPVIWATGNAVLAYNVALLLACLLAAMGARHLARVLGLDAVAAWAAGALYAFHTYQVNEGPRLNIVFHGFLPLVLACLIRYLRDGRRRDAWGLALFMLLQALSSNYHLLYGTLLVGLVVAMALVARPRLVAGRLPTLALAAGAAAALYAPVALVYLGLSTGHGYSRGLPAGIDLVHFLTTTPTNVLYGALGTAPRLIERGPHFVGFVSLALAGLAVIVTARRRTDAWVWVALALALLCVGFALGPEIVAFGRPLCPGPYRLLYEYVPGFRLVRYPERFSLPAMLFVGLLAGRGLAVVRSAGWPRLALALAVLIPLEHVSPLVTHVQVPAGARIPAVYEWLRTHPARAAIDLPYFGDAQPRAETLKMLFAAHHGTRIVNGTGAFQPLLTRLLLRVCTTFPSEACLQALQRVGVDTVILHAGQSLEGGIEGIVPSDAPEREARVARLLRVAGLDTYDRVPDALAEGRLVGVARFEGPQARLFESTADEVYRLRPQPPLPAAPFPAGRRLLKTGWSYRTKLGNPGPAADGNLATAWVVRQALKGDEFFEVVFDQPERVSGVVLPLLRNSQFPSRFRILTRSTQGQWREAARLDAPHVLQLVDALLREPREATLGFVLPGEPVTGIRLSIEEGGASFLGWNLPEVEVWTN
jgi:hypothetical protein